MRGQRIPVQKSKTARSERVIGAWYAIAAFTAWGLLPLYWKSLDHVPASQILAHRIFWSFIFVSILVFVQKRRRESIPALRSGRYKVTFLLSALTLGTNWFIYIWAVNTNQIVESSMGYFINPLLSVVLGIIFLKERLKPVQTLSVFVAFAGVAYLTVQYGKIPWIALSLAVSFAFYGLLRKTSKVGSVIGLLAETTILTPAALTYLIIAQIRGTGAFANAGAGTSLLLVGCGVVTSLPLIWFAHGARRIPLAAVGFTQYLAPTLMLFLGVFLYREPFTFSHLVSFGCVWTALVLYSLSHTRLFEKKRSVPSRNRKS
jgi:chloramphenicol-sensitive protein RarD